MSSTEFSSESPSSETVVEEKELLPPQEETWEKTLASFSSSEEKVSWGLEQMRQAISQEGSPSFRKFWEVRRCLLDVFRENINPAVRGYFWKQYIDLTVEARRLKEVLEEQSVFAIEQIDLAIDSLQKELVDLNLLLQEGEEDFFIPESLRFHEQNYQDLQKELNVLNTFATRLTALRKETMKTEIRLREKSKIFKKLSDLGDAIFPKRKVLIDQVSTQFQQDVESFVENNFHRTGIQGPYYVAREEVKSLQNFAKQLTLNSSTFHSTRLKLSECWDWIKAEEKEHKKRILQKKLVSSEQREVFDEKVALLKERAEGLALAELNQEIRLIEKEMKEAVLCREDLYILRTAFAELRAPHLAEQEKKAKEQEAIEQEKFRLKQEALEECKTQIRSLLDEERSLEVEAFSQRYQQILEKIASLSLSKMEKQSMDRQMSGLKDLLTEKKEQALLNLSEDDKKALENLRFILKQKKERREEIKRQLEVHRKLLGGSSLDFEKALHVHELVDQEKERLEKSNAGIAELEQKIAELES